MSPRNHFFHALVIASSSVDHASDEVSSLSFFWSLCFSFYIWLLMDILSSCNHLVTSRAATEHFVVESLISDRTRCFHLTALWTKSWHWSILNCLFKGALFYKIMSYYLTHVYFSICSWSNHCNSYEWKILFNSIFFSGAEL